MVGSDLEVGSCLFQEDGCPDAERGSYSCSVSRRGRIRGGLQVFLFLFLAEKEEREGEACALYASRRSPPSLSSTYLPPCASAYRVLSFQLPILPFVLDTWHVPPLSSCPALHAQLFSSS